MYIFSVLSEVKYLFSFILTIKYVLATLLLNLNDNFIVIIGLVFVTSLCILLYINIINKEFKYKYPHLYFFLNNLSLIILSISAYLVLTSPLGPNRPGPSTGGSSSGFGGGSNGGPMGGGGPNRVPSGGPNNPSHPQRDRKRLLDFDSSKDLHELNDNMTGLKV